MVYLPNGVDVKRFQNGDACAFKQTYKISEKEKTLPFLLKLKSYIARFFIYDKIRDIFGGRVRIMLSGAAPISPEIIHYFSWMGITIYEGYGMTENTGVISSNRPGFIKIGSVGQALPGTEIRIAEDGEICVRAPQNIQCYYKNEAATNELLEPDGNGGF